MAHTATLDWTASVDAVDGYNIYRSDTAIGPKTKVNIAPIVGTHYVDSTIGVGSVFYTTRAVKNGVESLDSNQVNAVVLPAPPTGLTLSAVS